MTSEGEVGMSKLATRAVVIGVVVGLLGVASYAVAGGGKGHLKLGTLSGYEENPDISTAASGTFEARIIGEKKIAYKLTYTGLEGTVSQAHIHFGKRGVNGGVSAFLCSNLPNPPAGTPACPDSGAVEGEIEAASVIGPLDQGIEPGAFAELIAAMRAGHTYANVHSSKWPGGEIRTQIRGEHRGDKHGKHKS
jgi:CHRD domain